MSGTQEHVAVSASTALVGRVFTTKWRRRTATWTIESEPILSSYGVPFVWCRNILTNTLSPLHVSDLPNAQGQPAATEPAQQAGRGPLGCADMLDAKPQIGAKP